MNKIAMYKEEIYKIASEKPKWSLKDKLGYARNIGINVAQDFVNAGNPLNIGSSIVGSVMDAAALEGVSMNMNKKIQQQELDRQALDNFNRAVDLKNGKAAIRAVNNAPKIVKEMPGTINQIRDKKKPDGAGIEFNNAVKK